MPLPDLIISSKTQGHYQAFNLFPEPLRIRNDLYQERVYKIHKLMVEVLGADAYAVGAERWVRRPTDENTVYYDLDGRTSWEELEKWFEAYRPLKKVDQKIRKVIYIGHILSTLGGQRIQESLAEVGNRNRWCYGLGLCLWDANVPVEEIRLKLIDWNSGLKVPLLDSEVTKILRSVISGAHHASPHVIAAITGLPSKVIGFYHLPKSRERRRRDHLSEVREDILSDLLSCGVITESQKAWAARLGLAYRSLKFILAHLKEEGILEASVGLGRYAQSSYSLSCDYLKSLQPVAYLEAAVGSEGMNLAGVSKGHTAISPLWGTLSSERALRVIDISVSFLFLRDLKPGSG